MYARAHSKIVYDIPCLLPRRTTFGERGNETTRSREDIENSSAFYAVVMLGAVAIVASTGPACPPLFLFVPSSLFRVFLCPRRTRRFCEEYRVNSLVEKA